MVLKKSKINNEEESFENKERYYYAVGRRKTAIARIKLFLEKGNQNIIDLNGKKMEEYLSIGRLIEAVKKPLDLAGEGRKFKITANVSGGGLASQAGAVGLAIARALVIFDEKLKKGLKDNGCLTRDARKVERKKPGLKKARRAPQWAKR